MSGKASGKVRIWRRLAIGRITPDCARDMIDWLLRNPKKGYVLVNRTTGERVSEKDMREFVQQGPQAFQLMGVTRPNELVGEWYSVDCPDDDEAELWFRMKFL